MMRILWAVLLCCALFSGALLQPVLAQDSQPAVVATAPADTTVDDFAKVEATLADLHKTLEKLRTETEKNETDDARLADVNVRVEQLGHDALAASVDLRPRFSQIKARLTEMGDAPAANAPAEDTFTADERAKLVADRARINALTQDAENISIAATQLANRITELRRKLFAEALFAQTPLNIDVFSEAWKSLHDESADFQRTFSSWLKFVWTFKKTQLLTAVFLSLCAALLFVAGALRIFAPLMLRDPAKQEPVYFNRLSVAFWSTIVPSAAIGCFSGTSYFLLLNFNVLRTDIAPVVAAVLTVFTAIFFVYKLTTAVLAPRQAAWRLVAVSDRGARFLRGAILFIALINSLDYVLSAVCEALNSPVVLTVVKSLIGSTIAGAILTIMAFARPMATKTDDDQPGSTAWPRIIAYALGLSGISLILAGAFGYVGLARFASTQIVLTGAIVVTMYIGLLTGRAISKRGEFGNTLLGQYLSETLQMNEVRLDQLGLVAGLGTYFMVMLFGIPLILLQWGFQVKDIQLWLYRFLTNITIGTISISIVGILAGIVVFVLGLFASRWFQRWLDGSVMERSQIEPGLRNSVRTATGYAGVALAGLIGISAAGIDLSSFALVAGALSLGIGFGLQNIVSNFVSGLILLAERPFKVGDWVVSDTTEGFVKRISVRATEIETFQNQSIIVPNSQLINASVGNWTHRNSLGRSEIAVSVSYASDPRQVMETLLEIARAHPLVMQTPEPVVAFLRFGEFALDFELRVYLADILGGTKVRNDLRLAIFERFKEEKIEIPFPQRNLNIRMEGETPVALDDTGPKPEGIAARERFVKAVAQATKSGIVDG